MLEVAYRNTTDDLIRYLDHRSSHRHHLGAQAIFLVVAACAAAVAGLAAVRGGGETLAVRAVALGAAVAGLALVMGPLARLVRRSSWRRMLGGERGDALRAPRRLRVEEGGLRAITLAGETLTPWAEVRGVTELPEHLIVQVGVVAAHVIPRDAFGSPAGSERFAQEIRDRITPRG